MASKQLAFDTARLVSSHAPTALSLVHAYVAVVQSHQVGRLMEHLKTALPVGSLQHLRRVKKARAPEQQQQAEVLLCALTDLQQRQQQQGSQLKNEHTPNLDSNPQQASTAAAAAAQSPGGQHQQQQHPYPANLPQSTASVLAACQAEVKVQQVPGCPPDNRKQWQEWTQLWPMPWRCRAGNAEQQDGLPPSTADQRYFEQHMAAVMAASAAAGGRNVARIVDPNTGNVVAESVDSSCGHPLDHAAMRAVEAVAARDRQLWPVNGFAHHGRAKQEEGSDDWSSIATEPNPHINSSSTTTPVAGDSVTTAAAAAGEVWQQQQQHGLPPCKKHKAGTDRAGHTAGQTCPADPISSRDDTSTAAAASNAHAADESNGSSAAPLVQAAANGDVDWSNKPYLCTGYDCFLAREACMLCGMALVHSRLQRVVYCQQDLQQGVLGGKVRLHAHSLNHRYLVYHMPAKQQQEQQQQQADGELPSAQGQQQLPQECRSELQLSELN